jgi:hypothetical protein
VDTVLVVDVANVVGSRPDGWWRDRAVAASRLLESLSDVRGTTVSVPGAATVRIASIVAVLEGTARSADVPDGVTAIAAVRDGDSAVVAEADRILTGGAAPMVVTADRGLRARLPTGAVVVGPGWLNELLGR